MEDLRAQGLVRIKVDVVEQKSSGGTAPKSSGKEMSFYNVWWCSFKIKE